MTGIPTMTENTNQTPPTFQHFSTVDCPLWDNYMYNDRECKEYRELILKPVAMFENPFFHSPHKIVLCDLWLNMETPSAINSRHFCKKTMDRLQKNHDTGQRPNKQYEPWFGIEQEYFVVGTNGLPVGFENEFRHVQGSHIYQRNLDVERQLADSHLKACLYAGINISGTIREGQVSQWEFQIGPCLGESIGDHLLIARFILVRLAEISRIRVTFDPLPVPGIKFTAGGHINFSTKEMREEGGIKYIKHAVKMLSNSHQEPLLRMYDPTLHQENNKRLSSGPYHPQINTFLWTIGEKVDASVRIPALVNVNGCGYFEDRRPPANLDPYAAADGLVRACIFGEFLKPEFEHLNDMT